MDRVDVGAFYIGERPVVTDLERPVARQSKTRLVSVTSASIATSMAHQSVAVNGNLWFVLMSLQPLELETEKTG